MHDLSLTPWNRGPDVPWVVKPFLMEGTGKTGMPKRMEPDLTRNPGSNSCRCWVGAPGEHPKGVPWPGSNSCHCWVLTPGEHPKGVPWPGSYSCRCLLLGGRPQGASQGSSLGKIPDNGCGQKTSGSIPRECLGEKLPSQVRVGYIQELAQQVPSTIIITIAKYSGFTWYLRRICVRELSNTIIITIGGGPKNDVHPPGKTI